MSDMTTVKVSPLTLRWIRRLKAFVEYKYGESRTMDEVLLFCVANTDYEMATEFKLTKKDMKGYFDEIIEKLKADDNVIRSLIDDLEAFGLVKR